MIHKKKDPLDLTIMVKFTLTSVHYCQAFPYLRDLILQSAPVFRVAVAKLIPRS